MQFSISTYLMQAEDAVLDFQFIPHECQCSSPLLTFSFTCNNEEYQIEREGVEVLIHCSAARLNLTVANVTQQAFGDYIVLVSASETHGGAIAFTNLTMVSNVLLHNGGIIIIKLYESPLDYYTFHLHNTTHTPQSLCYREKFHYTILYLC